MKSPMVKIIKTAGRVFLLFIEIQRNSRFSRLSEVDEEPNG